MNPQDPSNNRGHFDGYFEPPVSLGLWPHRQKWLLKLHFREVRSLEVKLKPSGSQGLGFRLQQTAKRFTSYRRLKASEIPIQQSINRKKTNTRNQEVGLQACTLTGAIPGENCSCLSHGIRTKPCETLIFIKN